MRLLRSIRKVGAKREARMIQDGHPHSWLYGVGWASAGVTALALGVVVGREIRQRYKFHRRTPYDFYAHSGDQQDIEFGVGI